MCKCADFNLKMCKCANMQMCKFGDVQMCRFEEEQMFVTLKSHPGLEWLFNYDLHICTSTHSHLPGAVAQPFYPVVGYLNVCLLTKQNRDHFGR